jgi:hypothetical protein
MVDCRQKGCNRRKPKERSVVAFRGKKGGFPAKLLLIEIGKNVWLAQGSRPGGRTTILPGNAIRIKGHPSRGRGKWNEMPELWS